MSASMLRQMLEDAGALLKEHKYQDALDASRRVTQFDPNNFQAFMCVGLANFNLKQWEDSEEAYRRAAGIKPEMPVAWKNLVDLFDESKQPQKKLEPLEKLVAIFQRTNKVKASQKWIAEIAATALELKLYAKAFIAWHSLVVAQSDATRDVCLDVTPNDELPSTLAIWLDLAELLQRPGFSLSECATEFSQAEVTEQFFRAAATWSADAISSVNAAAKLDAAVAFFMRSSLDALKAAKPATKTKTALLRQLDAQALSIIRWLPAAKIPAEYLLLRSEDTASPIELEQASQLALELEAVHPKSPMVQIFKGMRLLAANEPEQARATIVEGLAYCASSAFFESALCIRAHVELAALALAARDVESCLSRLQHAKGLVVEKAQAFGCAPPRSDIFSDSKAQLMDATAREYAGDVDKALTAYQTLIDSAEDAAMAFQALARVAELLLLRGRVADTRDALNAFARADALGESDRAVLASLRGWVHFELGAVDTAQALLEPAVAAIPATRRAEKAQALKRLAIVYWHVGDVHREDKAFCFGLLLQAAKLHASDSETFGWLGRWYECVAKDAVRAEKCYLKALALAPGNELAGVALSELYEQQQQPVACVKLWEDVTREPVTAPTWALLRLAQHLVECDDERAVIKLHLVLRNDPLSARHWVALGHVYRHFGKLVSAHKSYLRAVELDGASWCVMCELARLEGAMLLFDEAFAHIEPFVVPASLSSNSEQTAVVSMLYAELLLKQAKYLSAEGLYGHAAANLRKAARLMTALSSSSLCGSVEGLKLIGDIHCFAFYLSPDDFDDATQAPVAGSTPWVDFIANGRKAFEATAAMLAESAGDVAPATRAEVCYDLGLSCWYEAMALCTAHGVALSGFEHRRAPYTARLLAALAQQQPALLARVETLQKKAKTHFANAVNACPQLARGWNGLGVVLDHVLAKQFAWIRAIEAESNDAAWANLGMLYVHQPEGRATAALAQKALIHLQGVNASNPSMWNGYGMLARRERASAAAQHKARESFKCALEVGLDVDALQGYASVTLLQSASAADSSSSSSSEELLFALRKVLEREPLDAGAWNALGVLQQRLGRADDARASFGRAQALVSEFPWYAQPVQHSGLAWNASVAEVSAAVADGDAEALTDAFNQAIAAVKAQPTTPTAASSSVLLSVLNAQRLFHGSDAQGSLHTLASLLESELTSSERDAVAAVALAVAGLVRDDAGVPRELVQRVRALSKQQLVTERISAAQLHVVEMHDRATGRDADVQSLLEIARVGDAPPTCVWPRLAFALVDFQDLQSSFELTRALAAAKPLRSPCGEDARDAAYAQALAALLLDPQPHSANERSDDGAAAATSAVRATRKLVHMVPWEPLAYVLAGAALLKRHALLSTSNVSASQQRHALDSAALVLEHGMRVAGASATHAFARAQLQWLQSICYVQLGDAVRASTIVADALVYVEATKPLYPSQALTFELLAARLQSSVDPVASVGKFRAVLARLSSSSPDTAASSKRAVSVLCELGAVYETAGLHDCALQVWKTVASLSASANTESAVGCFFANLRLALVHGAKQNVKAAKKQIKSTVALAPSPESLQATVASFVENVLAKSS